MFVYMLTVCSGNRAASPSLESAAESGLWDLITHGCHQQHSFGVEQSRVRAPVITGWVCGRPDCSSSTVLPAKGSSAWPSWGCVQPCIIPLTISRCIMSQHGQIPGLKCTQLQSGCEANSLAVVELSGHNMFECFSVKIQKCVCLFPPFPC